MNDERLVSAEDVRGFIDIAIIQYPESSMGATQDAKDILVSLYHNTLKMRNTKASEFEKVMFHTLSQSEFFPKQKHLLDSLSLIREKQTKANEREKNRLQIEDRGYNDKLAKYNKESMGIINRQIRGDINEREAELELKSCRTKYGV